VRLLTFRTLQQERISVSAGNMTQDGSGLTYTFDAENRLTLASGMSGGPYCYVYDGNGLRVAKKSNASSCSSGTVTKIYWRSLSGDALAEMDGSGSTTNSAYNEYVFFAGRRVGSRNGSGGIFYWFADQLGTTRSITTGNGPGQTSGQLCYDADFTPYGQEMQHTEHLQTTACPPNYKFTGYERDTETGLDYAFARYYSSSLGRFLSTDPLGGSIGSLQSHNAYAYVLNDPINFVDPTGMNLVAPGQCDMSHGLCGGFALGLQIFPIFGLYNGEEEPPLLGFLLDFSFGYFGPSGGAGGPANSTVNKAALEQCANQLFGVGMTSFTPSVPGDSTAPGANGSFSGVMAGIYNGTGNPLLPGPYQFTVTNDVTMNWQSITLYEIRNGSIGPNGRAFGYTPSYAPFTNFSARNIPASGMYGLNYVQIWELGNSLGFITGKQIPAVWNYIPGSSNEPGQILEDCYGSYTLAEGRQG
jgi:RHS repeat-associated protein